MEKLVLADIPRKILIVKPSALGDIVLSLPVLDTLSRTYPAASIQWVVARGFDGFLEDHPLIDRLWIIDKQNWKKIARLPGTIGEMRTLFSGLRRENFDLVLDLQGLLRSAVIAAATRAKVRIGFAEAREGSTLFYSHLVQSGQEVHAVRRYLTMAAFVGCESSEPHFPLPPFPDGRNLGLPDRYAVIVPSAGKVANRWPASRFGTVAACLSIPSIVVSGKGDASIAEEVVRHSEGKAISLAGKTTLKELVSVIKGASSLISNDTGPMHIAAALGIPVVAIFGPANPQRTGPHGIGHRILYSSRACAPCYKRRCDNAVCLTDITVDMVLQALEDSKLSHLPVS